MNQTLHAVVLTSTLLAVGLMACVWLRFDQVADRPSYGATFSPAYARYLGLNDRETFLAMIDELDLSYVRLPVQWDEIEPTSNISNYEQLDWYLDQAAKHNVGIILAIGNKVPRWPECYAPGWAKALPPADYNQALLDYVDAVVTRYRTHPAVARWQVENEPLFPFGTCPEVDMDLVGQEIAHVKALDPKHPVQLTVSGEQQAWASLAMPADVLGASMYRTVALPNYSTLFTFPIPARWYTAQALSVAFFVDKVIISELQVEPWMIQDYRTYTAEEAASLFTPARLRRHLKYARSTGIQEISLWGVEWWYYLKQNGQPDLWQAGQASLDWQN